MRAFVATKINANAPLIPWLLERIAGDDPQELRCLHVNNRAEIQLLFKQRSLKTGLVNCGVAFMTTLTILPG
jgi:hypothetical protein